GASQVGHQSIDAYLGDLRDALENACELVELTTEPSHAGVDLEVHAYRSRSSLRRKADLACNPLGLRDVVDDRRDAARDDLTPRLTVISAHDQKRHSDPRFSQLDRFFE